MTLPVNAGAQDAAEIESRIQALLGEMTLDEKIGQMTLVHSYGPIEGDFLENLRAGRIGAILNDVDLARVNEMQRIAVEETRLGIPLLVGRDVIHGFRTVMPIPLGQAASWNPELVERGARIAALEAASHGVNWTFAPMIDITRDPRWGRIAETLGEDPHLASVLGAAMVRGFQGDDLAALGTIAACAKHFAGYGASEAGRDYATTNIPENELRNVFLPPFKAALDAGVASFMTSFSDLNGVPATGNSLLLQDILRDEWQYDGFVVSDWASVEQLKIHGLTANDRESALAAVTAGVDMEMASTTYREHLADLVADGEVSEATLDEMVGNVLRAKLMLGLFENAQTDPAALPPTGNPTHLQVALESAVQSLVLLKNDNDTLPLSDAGLSSVAVIGPLADDGYEQLGTWIFDGDPSLSQTPLAALTGRAGDAFRVRHVRAMETSRSRDAALEEAAAAARDADVALLFLGEESILSGEAHSRADISLPGSQEALVKAVAATGTPVVAVIMAGRPLTLANVLDDIDALVYAWHPGTMAGPAIVRVLFGDEVPSGKLPVTFPRMVGQVPIYYSQKNTGKPATPESVVHIDDIEVRAAQTSFGMTSFHLDAGATPQFPFGFGLSYTTFAYSDLELDREAVPYGGTLTASAVLTNTGKRAGTEIVQLYIRDPAASVTRPVRELKGFQRVTLAPGESRRISFRLTPELLSFTGRDMQTVLEPGEFRVWIGGNSDASLQARFDMLGAD